MYLQGKTGEWECVIGLEVHAQISSNSKLFSSSSTKFGSHPNENVSIIDASMPGMLPVLNKYCVEQAVKTGLALNSTIHKISIFDRKHYFYPDLPQGYQISQFYHPIVTDGYIDISAENGQDKRITINRIHIEQDAGKSIHDKLDKYTCIDLNRSGIALMEIVSNPDLSTAEEVSYYLKKLRSILRYIGSSDGDMEKGSMRCDANVSVRRPGDKLGVRCEIKNLNSIRNTTIAIEYESKRQIEMLENGEEIQQETRLFNSDTGETKAMRSKEDAVDYRYFADPDLLPVILTDEYIQNIAGQIPELPDQKINRYIKEGLSQYDANVLASDQKVAMYFDEVVQKGASNKISANWILTELFGAIKKHNISFDESEEKIPAKNLSDLIQMIEKETISGKIAKTVFEDMFINGTSPQEIIKTRNLVQLSNKDELSDIIENILNNNESSVVDYHNGKTKLIGFFVGAVMKETKGTANPKIVNDILIDKLNKYKK